MKVTVNTYLNVRVGKPSVNAPCYQYLAPGSELEVDDKLYKGDMFEGSNLWYRDKAKNYYWAGGVAKDTEKEPEAVQPQTGFSDYINARFKNGVLSGNINYNDLLGITSSLKNNKGSGATVGVLDHGISDSVPLKNLQRISAAQVPANSHGCYMASLIAGNGNITGIAPQCDMLEFPLYNTTGYKDAQLLQNVVNYISQHPQRQFIINVSQAIGPNEMPVFQPIFEQFRPLANAVLVAAAGTNDELFSAQIQYPARMPGVIAVGSINQRSGGTLNPRVDLLVPELLYAAYAKQPGKLEYAAGDSSACAIVSGVVALLYAENNVPFNSGALLGRLKSMATPLGQIPSFDTLNLIKP